MSPVDTSFLNPTTQAVLANLPKVDDFSKVTLETLRQPIALQSELPKPHATIESIQLPSSITDDHLIHVDVFRPKDAPSDAVLPALIFLPGGGYTVQANQTHTFLSAKLAVEANCVVLLVHYSLSPEVKFPVAIEEGYSIVAYATNPETAAKLSIDPTRVAVGGDSSGSNLAIAITLFAKQRGDLKNKIKYQVLYYPITRGDTYDTESYEKFGEGYLLTKEQATVFLANYMTEEAKGNILFAPDLATTEQLKGLPPALLIVAEADIIRDDGEMYGRKLLKAGVPVSSFRVNGTIHGFMTYPFLMTEETHLTIDLTISALRRAFTNK